MFNIAQRSPAPRSLLLGGVGRRGGGVPAGLCLCLCLPLPLGGVPVVVQLTDLAPAQLEDLEGDPEGEQCLEHGIITRAPF